MKINQFYSYIILVQPFLKVDYTGLNTLLPSIVSRVPINNGSTLGFLIAAL